MTLNEEKNEFSALAASRRSTRAFTDREMPAGVIDAILADATTAPSWSNTRAFRVAIASGARAQRLRDRFGKLFDEEIEAHARKVIDPDVEIPVPDGDYPVRKRYPDELLPAQIEVAKLLYGTYGVERADIEGRNRVNRRNVTAFDAPVMGFVFVHEDMLPWSAMDAGLMLQTLFLSAKSRGIDSCPVGILATWRAPVDEEFEIPEGYKFITGFALGYADPDAPINSMQAPRPPIQLLEGK